MSRVMRDVDLDDVGCELEDVPQAREPGAGVVDRDPGAHRTQPRQGPVELVVVVDLLVLGDLHDDATRHRREERLDLGGRGGAVRAVDRQVRAGREPGERRRGPARSSRAPGACRARARRPRRTTRRGAAAGSTGTARAPPSRPSIRPRGRRSAGRPSRAPRRRTNRRISSRRASRCSNSISSRRSWELSSWTMPPITSADRLVPPPATRLIEPTISSAAVPFTR